MHFHDRAQAGDLLAQQLVSAALGPCIVCALPRGGVVLGVEVAKQLQVPLDLVIPRKVGHPQWEEYAVCAVTEDGHIVCDESEISQLDPVWLQDAISKQQAEAKRRRLLYLADRKPVRLAHKTVVIVDDGVATGLTVRAAIETLRGKHPARIILAVPVIPAEVAADLQPYVDTIIALEKPQRFRGSVGAYYDIFEQVSDKEVISLLQQLQALSNIARPWGEPRDMDPLLAQIGDACYVLLGEASHGTHEYYLWRARLSERLIREKGFSFIAVEGDWPDCYRINRYVKHYPRSGQNARTVLRTFARWPTWMWANEEVAQLMDWLRHYNAHRAPSERVGFYGLDVYSLWESMHAVVNYLETHDSAAATKARQLYHCFDPYHADSEAYARRVRYVPASCEMAVIEVLRQLQTRAPHFEADHEAAFNAEQNARVAVHAEHYYRTMLNGDTQSWNIRDRHMVDTLQQLMQHHGPHAKAIVWAHNTHIGDARFTTMADVGMVNVGQLIRQAAGAGQTTLVGFGSYAGRVIAGRYWDAPMEIMSVPPARPESWEALLHRVHPRDMLVLSYEYAGHNAAAQRKGHRAIGVVYDPQYERGNYVSTLLPKRYDAFIYIDHTKALRPLHLPVQPEGDYPDTFPWGT